jgi:hypothetical protein
MKDISHIEEKSLKRPGLGYRLMRTAGKLSIGFEDAPWRSTKTRQADSKHGFVSIYLPGLFGSNGCGFSAVAGDMKTIPTLRISPYPSPGL